MYKKTLITSILLLALLVVSPLSAYGYSQDISYEKFTYPGAYAGQHFLWSPCRDANNNEDFRNVTSKYNNPRPLSSSPHGGVDFSTSGQNLNLYSIGNGKVVAKNTSDTSAPFGFYVIIQLDVNNDLYYDPVYVRYAHLQSSPVSVGQVVSPSTIVDVSGSTGTSAAHLHIDLRNNNNSNTGVIHHLPFQPYYSNRSH